MKPPRTLVKVAAVASSVLLAGAFIAYRAGAFDRYLVKDVDEGRFMPSSKVSQIITTPPTPPDATDWQPVPVTAGSAEMLAGSKSAILLPPSALTPVPTTPPSGNTPQPPPVFLGGSKSLALPAPVPGLTPATPATPAPAAAPPPAPPQ